MGKKKKKCGHISLDRQRLKKCENSFYRLIRRIKKEFWQTFLERNKKETINSEETHLENETKC